MDDLREMLYQPADEEDATWILAIVDKMLDNLQQQFELEENNGYFAEVLERYPNWYPQVEHLRQQHTMLCRQLREIRERIAGEPAKGPINRETRRQLNDWMNTYRDHRIRETDLIQDAFTLETGMGE